MKDLREFVEEKEELSDVKSRWTPPEGLFTKDDPECIAKVLIDNAKDPGQAMKRLTFYMNRAGDDCPNKTVLNKVKEIIRQKGI